MSTSLQDIPADTELGRILLGRAYSALMSRGFDKARFQAGSVALQRFVHDKPSSPVVLYASKLDDGNELEIAIEPGRLAAAFEKPEPTVWKWLEQLQGELVEAKPKTAEKYPRVGIVSEAALDSFISSWESFRSGRDSTPSRVITKPNLTPLQISELAKAATDHGFDLSPAEDGSWLLCRSTQFSEKVWMTFADGVYQLSSDSARILDELKEEGFHTQPSSSLPSGNKLAIHLNDYSSLYQLLDRVAELAKSAPAKLVEQFVAVTKSMPESTEVERLVKQRVGQDIFRNALIAFWQCRCAVTGLAISNLLRASHIKPWSDCASNEERLDVFNGLLLAPHLDALFDGGWITFDDTGSLVRSGLLDDGAMRLLGITTEMRLSHITTNHQPYLEYHRQHIFKSA